VSVTADSRPLHEAPGQAHVNAAVSGGSHEAPDLLKGGGSLLAADYDARVTLPGEELAAAMGLVAVPLARCGHALARRYIGRGRLRVGGTDG
jgi:hypothetical protein